MMMVVVVVVVVVMMMVMIMIMMKGLSPFLSYSSQMMKATFPGGGTAVHVSVGLVVSSVGFQFGSQRTKER